MVEVRLAQQGMAMQDGTVLQWLKQVGDRVVKDEVIAEVETAKAIMDVVAPASGILSKILVLPEENVPVQTLLAVIDEG